MSRKEALEVKRLMEAEVERVVRERDQGRLREIEEQEEKKRQAHQRIEMAMPKLKGVIDLFEGLRDSGVVGGGTGESATVFVRMVDMTESYERNGRYNRGRKEENCLFPGVVLCFDFWGTDGRDDGFSHGYSKVTAYVDQERLMIVGCLSWMSKVVENPSDLNTVVAKAILDPERVDIFNGWPLDWGPG